MGIKPINAGVPMHAWKMDAKPMLSDDDDEFPSLSIAVCDNRALGATSGKTSQVYLPS